MNAQLPSAYSFLCANQKECAPMSYSELFNISSIVSKSGPYKGKTLEYFINKKFPLTSENVILTKARYTKVSYEKTKLPSVF